MLPLKQVRTVLTLDSILHDVVEVGEDAGDSVGVVPCTVTQLVESGGGKKKARFSTTYGTDTGDKVQMKQNKKERKKRSA